MPLLRGAVQSLFLQVHTSTINIDFEVDGKASKIDSQCTHGHCPFLISDSSMFLGVDKPYQPEILAQAAVAHQAEIPFIAKNGNTPEQAFVAEVKAQLEVTGQAAVPPTFLKSSIKFTSGISTVTAKDGSTYFHKKRFCEIIARMYKLDIELEKTFFNSPVHSIPYKKYVTAQRIGIKPGESFNFQIDTAIHKMRDLLILPLLSESCNGNIVSELHTIDDSKKTFSTLQSPYTTAGNTCGPYVSVVDYQVLINHNPYFKHVKKLSRDLFDEIKRIGMSGGLDYGMSNQLLSQTDFDSTHGFLYTDLTRANSEIDYMSARSIVVQGKNNSPYCIDLMAYLSYGARVSIDTSISKIVVESNQEKNVQDEENHQSFIESA